MLVALDKSVSAYGRLAKPKHASCCALPAIIPI
jgi:hypothetical protein